jgi:methionyl-tRNA formyltransferase
VAVHRAQHEVVLVLTQPDRPAGRHLRLAASPVKRFAQTEGIRVLQPGTLRGPAREVHAVRELRPDVLVVAAYGLLLPPALLDAGAFGAVNIHASLLPRWRGAAPIQRALLAGDSETGISIMQMDAGLDTGPVLAQHRIGIDSDADSGSLHDRLAALGAAAIVEALADLEAGRARAVPQPAEGATYAPKIDKRETRLDWSKPAQELERAVRAFRPAPGAFALLDGEAIKIWRSRIDPGEGAPGTLLRAGDELIVACARGALAISELQRPGGRRLSALEFLRGRPMAVGARFA